MVSLNNMLSFLKEEESLRMSYAYYKSIGPSTYGSDGGLKAEAMVLKAMMIKGSASKLRITCFMFDSCLKYSIICLSIRVE